MALVQKIGVIPETCAIVVGAWDPLFPNIEKSIKRMARACAKSDHYKLLPVLIDPSPPAMLNPSNHPRFECAEARLGRILDCGVEGAIRLRLSKKDLEQGIEFLLDLLGKHTAVKCIFLGKYQSLGSAGRGDPRTIRRVCSSRDIKVLPSNISTVANKRSVYALYRRNAFVKMAGLIGRPLSWMGRVGNMRVPLKPGTYQALVASSNASLTSADAQTLRLIIDEAGQVQLDPAVTLYTKDPLWIAPTRFMRRAK